MKEKDYIDKLKYEKEYQQKGYKMIAGCDEAGRGPLAGPVVVASVIMPIDDLIDGVDDSKKLTEKKRDELFDKIIEKAIDYKISIVSEKVIDEINILQATKQGMEECINGLKIKPDFALIDAVKGLNLVCEFLPLIKGDYLSYSIGCASILAKVTRDRLMVEMAQIYPEYSFEKHKGYGTKAHIEAIKKYGKCPIHRDTFIKHFV
ncbi:MAG: ribonuclease HII [Christensenellales bacterium]